MNRTLKPLSNERVGCADRCAVAEDEAEGQHQWLNTARTIANDMTNSESQIAIWPKM